MTRPEVWRVERVAPEKPPREKKRPWWRRKEPTTFQRCLALHLYGAENKGAPR